MSYLADLLDSRMDVELTPLDIPDLLATKPAEKAKSAKKYHVDKRCLLTEAYVSSCSFAFSFLTELVL